MRKTKSEKMKLYGNHESSGHILAFEVAGQRYGVLLAHVVEVIRAVAVSKILKAPPAVEGIINLRGTIVPVLDIRTRFGLPEKVLEPADRMVVVRANQRHAVLRVDRTVGVMEAGEGIFDRGKSARSAHVRGVIKLPDGLLLIYDIDSFLSDADADLFSLALAEEAEA